jgi:tetratricopeptide (TPR) repeat protein
MKTPTKLSILVIALFAMAWPSSITAQTLQDAINFTQSEQFENAGKAYQTLISQQPQDGTNFFYYGDYFIRQYRADTVATSLKKACTNANAQFEKGKTADPLNPLNYIGLGEVALFNKNLAKAQEYFNQAMDQLPSKKNKIKMDKSIQATAYVKLADAYVQSNTNDTTAIFNAIRQAQKLDPKNFESYLVAGDTYIYMLNDGSKAVTSYHASSKLNPKSPAAQLKIGQLWKRAKIYDSALAAYKAVIQIDQNYAPAYKELGFLNAQLGNTTEAKNNFQRFLELSSGNTDAQMQYINTLFQLKDFNEVINQSNKLLATNQSNPDIYRALGYASLEAGKTDDAVAALDNFFKKASDDKIRSTDYYYYARAMSNLKKDSIAGNYYIKAYQEDTTHYDYLNIAAMSYFNSGSYHSAIDAFQKKIATGYYKLSDYYYMGYSYQILKQYDKAIAQYSAIIEKSPDYIQAYLLKARCYSSMDPKASTPDAQIAYSALVDKTEKDASKYTNERGEAYSYLNYYYFMQFFSTKSKDDARKSIEYGKKALEINPNNDKAKTINDNLEKNLNRAAQPK